MHILLFYFIGDILVSTSVLSGGMTSLDKIRFGADNRRKNVKGFLFFVMPIKVFVINLEFDENIFLEDVVDYIKINMSIFFLKNSFNIFLKLTI